MRAEPEKLLIELRDPFGTVVAMGAIEVNEQAITPAELVGGDSESWQAVAGPPVRLADSPLRVHVEGNFVQQDAPNPHLLWYVKIRLAD